MFQELHNDILRSQSTNFSEIGCTICKRRHNFYLKSTIRFTYFSIVSNCGEINLPLQWLHSFVYTSPCTVWKIIK